MAPLHASSGRLDTFPITVHAGLACLQRALAVLDCHSGAFESSIVVGDSSSTCLSVHMALQHAPSGCASVLSVARVTGLAGEQRVLHGFAELLSLCAHLQPARFTVTALQVAVLPLPIHVVVGNGTFLALTSAAHLGIVSLCLLPLTAAGVWPEDPRGLCLGTDSSGGEGSDVFTGSLDGSMDGPMVEWIFWNCLIFS